MYHALRLPTITALLASTLASAAGTATDRGPLRLQDAIKIPDQTLDFGKSVELTLPPLPAKAEKIVVLRFRAVSYAPTEAGCNYNAVVQINDAPLGRHTSGGGERLIGRPPTFEFRRDYPDSFPVFSGGKLMVLFAPDVDAADRMTKDGLGGTFVLDISDVARGVDGNTLLIRNTRGRSDLSDRYDLIVRDIEIGWLDKDRLPKPPVLVPQREPIAASVSADELRLSQAAGGGFAVAAADGAELLVETALGMSAGIASDLIAADGPAAADPKVKIAIEPYGRKGYRVTAAWPTVKLVRTVEVSGGLVVWKERWSNATDRIIGVPLRHRLFLRDQEANFLLGGNPDLMAMSSAPQNPTIYLGAADRGGNGIGITAESDWLRMLMWLRSAGGVGEIYSQSLALPPLGGIEFTLTIAPVTDGGGYWSFINGVRRRWGSNRAGVERPIFFDHARTKDGATPEERVRKSLGHLGPITVALGPWVRLSFDTAVVCGGQYPKLPADAPRAAGNTPDLDVDAFTTFAHREPHWKQYADEVAMIHKTCPDVRVIQLMHPAMEVAYKPLADRWPYAEDAIRTPAGEPFENAYYSRAHLGDFVGKGWGVLYYVPRPGSAYLSALLRDVRRSLDAVKCDGIYFDEFSWAWSGRTYSRYDYASWDGYSADLDESGNVVRLKSDNAVATESCQLQIVDEVVRRGKTFLGNGAGVLRSVCDQPIARFIEGGNGFGHMAGGHLATVPLVLGNFGDLTTRKGVMAAVRDCLSIGCIYSPMGVNLLLDGPDNFVCKLYPLTIRELRAGTVIGEERLITARSGQFAWPGRQTSVRLYEYDKNGDLTSKDKIVQTKADGGLKLTVPECGLVTAEVMP